MRNRISCSIALALLATLAACGGQAPLISKGVAVPTGVDFSGQWQLIGDAQADMTTSMSDDVQVDVFLENGESLKVTQTDYGLFVSFDRAIVEEYRYGENRTISVGPVEADRASGWEAGTYIIETRDKKGALLTETYQLDRDHTRMTRVVSIVYRGKPELELRQVYEKR